MLGNSKRAQEHNGHLCGLPVVRCSRACPEHLLVTAFPLPGDQTPVHEGQPTHPLLLHRVMLYTVARSSSGLQRLLVAWSTILVRHPFARNSSTGSRLVKVRVSTSASPRGRGAIKRPAVASTRVCTLTSEGNWR